MRGRERLAGQAQVGNAPVRDRTVVTPEPAPVHGAALSPAWSEAWSGHKVGHTASVIGRGGAAAVQRRALLQLQRSHGNRFVQCYLKSSEVSAVVGPAAGPGAVAPDVEHAIAAARGGGSSLDSAVRREMEGAFGTEFSGVRVHTDGTADRLNRSLNAQAFTTGQDIFFRQGQYQPYGVDGRGLIAHELTHVVQQGNSTVRTKLMLGEPGDRAEEEADRVSRAVVQRQMAPAGAQPGELAIDAGHDGSVIRRAFGKKEATVLGAVGGTLIGVGIGMLAEGGLGGLIGGVVGAIVGGTVGAALGLSAGVPDRIRAASTPAAMVADRIPPRVGTPVAVSRSGIGDVQLEVENSGTAAGTVTINGNPQHNLASSGTVQLSGTVQTVPGNASQLHLVAKNGTTVLARSAGFSVSAIPQDFEDSLNGARTAALVFGGAALGIVVNDVWDSDSQAGARNPVDLDQVTISEHVQVTTETGCLNGLGGGNNSGYLPGDEFTSDTHSTGVGWFPGRPGAGTQVLAQTSSFIDNRTNAGAPIPMPRSGLSITRTVLAPPGANRTLETEKHGAHVTANGITSEAGTTVPPGGVTGGPQAII